VISNLGKYELRREIGRGAMGVVYEAYDPMIKRVVALKTIRSDQLTGEESGTVIARFRREAQAAGRLSHPNIVPIYDFGEDGGVWFIAMEFIKGRELKEYFEANERFSVADIVRIMSQMLDALDYSHRQGVIHRDIKPANVFLIEDGSVKVADFGIAHIDSSSLTQVGTVLGTPSYMSPEQIMGLPVDGRSDLFSAGVILYQFLTGERPFAGSATTTMQKVLKEDPLPPSSLNVQVLPAMDAVMRKALAKRADERFQTAKEFAAAIHAAAAESTGSMPISLPTSAEATMLSIPDPTLVAPARAAAMSTTAGAAQSASIPSPGPLPDLMMPRCR
jgi:serine/threonine-protein kinase